MGQGVAARIDRLQSAQLARDVYGRADAMLVVIARDLLEEVNRHQRDHGSRAPTFLLQREFQNVRLLLGNVPVEQCLVLLEVADPNRHAIPMAAWIGHEISRREDSWRENLAWVPSISVTCSMTTFSARAAVVHNNRAVNRTALCFTWSLQSS